VAKRCPEGASGCNDQTLVAQPESRRWAGSDLLSCSAVQRATLGAITGAETNRRLTRERGMAQQLNRSPAGPPPHKRRERSDRATTATSSVALPPRRHDRRGMSERPAHNRRTECCQRLLAAEPEEGVIPSPSMRFGARVHQSLSLTTYSRPSSHNTTVAGAQVAVCRLQKDCALCRRAGGFVETGNTPSEFGQVHGLQDGPDWPGARRHSTQRLSVR
jgi:hypothetical protein